MKVYGQEYLAAEDSRPLKTAVSILAAERRLSLTCQKSGQEGSGVGKAVTLIIVEKAHVLVGIVLANYIAEAEAVCRQQQWSK
jgi:hypothetical protein